MHDSLNYSVAVLRRNKLFGSFPFLVVIQNTRVINLPEQTPANIPSLVSTVFHSKKRKHQSICAQQAPTLMWYPCTVTNMIHFSIQVLTVTLLLCY